MRDFSIQKMMAERNVALPEAKRVLYRMGVNIGDVLVEGDDILGDGVNVAARLEGICGPGGVCVSGAVYEHIYGHIGVVFADLGAQTLKNIAKPVRAYALSATPSQRPTRPRRRSRPQAHRRRWSGVNRRAFHSSSCLSPISATSPRRSILSTA